MPIAPPGPSPGRIIVFDGESGAVRWMTPPAAGHFAAPYCVDVNADGTDDVLIAGRSGDVIAYSGVDGTALWTLGQGSPEFLSAGNTYAVVAESPDADVLFVAKGGGGGVQGNDDIPGRLLVVDPLGGVITTWFEPEGREIYSAPAVTRGPSGELLVAVGSGGERAGGVLHLLELDEGTMTLMERAATPSTCATGGFVGSPVFGDVTGDGAPELVDLDYCGAVHVVGLDGGELWTHTSEVAFGTANVVLAELNGDAILDVVAAFESFNFSFPDETSADPRSRVVALDGPTGTPSWSYDTARWVFASPVTADFDGDGTEDVMLMGSGAFSLLTPELTVLSGGSGQVLYTEELGETATTPVIDDVDGDGHLDVFLTEMSPVQQRIRALRLEFCGRPFVPGQSESGFRGHPVHDGYRP